MCNKKFTLVLVTVLSLLVVVSCGDDNNYDGPSGLVQKVTVDGVECAPVGETGYYSVNLSSEGAELKIVITPEYESEGVYIDNIIVNKDRANAIVYLRPEIYPHMEIADGWKIEYTARNEPVKISILPNRSNQSVEYDFCITTGCESRWLTVTQSAAN